MNSIFHIKIRVYAPDTVFVHSLGRPQCGDSNKYTQPWFGFEQKSEYVIKMIVTIATSLLINIVFQIPI